MSGKADAIKAVRAILSEHFGTALIIVEDRTPGGRSFIRLIPVGIGPSFAYALLTAASDEAQTIKHAKQQDDEVDGESAEA
jgi:hypothetical protein